MSLPVSRLLRGTLHAAQLGHPKAIHAGVHTLPLEKLFGGLLHVRPRHLVGQVHPADEAALLGRLLLTGAADLDVLPGEGDEPQLPLRVSCVERHGGHILRVVADEEVAADVAPEELPVGQAFRGQHLPRVALSVDRLLQPRGGVFRGVLLVPLAEDPEHVERRDGRRFGVLGLAVHVDPPAACGRVRRLVPLLTTPGVELPDLLERGQVAPVGKDELTVGVALVLPGRHVLTGEEPVAVQVALLKAAEDALDRFRLPVVGLRGDGQLGHATEEVAVLQFAVSALVVEADLVRLAAGGLERHLVGEELCLHVLPRADVVAQQDFAVGVHHLVDAAGGHSSLRVAVVIVQARTVAIPDGVSHLRQGCLVVAGEELLGLQLAVAQAVPQGAHLGPIQKAPDGVLRADGLPPALPGHAVIRLEELLHRQAVDGCGVAGDEPFSGLLLEAQGGVVAVVLRYEGGVALLLEAHDEPAEAAFAHRQ